MLVDASPYLGVVSKLTYRTTPSRGQMSPQLTYFPTYFMLCCDGTIHSLPNGLAPNCSVIEHLDRALPGPSQARLLSRHTDTDFPIESKCGPLPPGPHLTVQCIVHGHTTFVHGHNASPPTQGATQQAAYNQPGELSDVLHPPSIHVGHSTRAMWPTLPKSNPHTIHT